MDSDTVSLIVDLAKRGGGDASVKDVELLSELCEQFGPEALDEVEARLKNPGTSIAEVVKAVQRFFCICQNPD